MNELTAYFFVFENSLHNKNQLIPTIRSRSILYNYDEYIDNNCTINLKCGKIYNDETTYEIYRVAMLENAIKEYNINEIEANLFLIKNINEPDDKLIISYNPIDNIINCLFTKNNMMVNVNLFDIFETSMYGDITFSNEIITNNTFLFLIIVNYLKNIYYKEFIFEAGILCEDWIIYI